MCDKFDNFNKKQSLFSLFFSMIFQNFPCIILNER